MKVYSTQTNTLFRGIATYEANKLHSRDCDLED